MNPHLIALATISDAASSASVYIIDSVTGSLVWSASHNGQVAKADTVYVALTENWLVYAFADNSSEGLQTTIVSVELYEPINSDSRGMK